MSDGRAGVRRGLAPAVVVLVLSIGYLPWAYSYDAQGQLVPVLIGWLLLGLSVLDIVAHTDTHIGRTLFGLVSGRAMDAGNEEPGTTHGFRRQAVAVLWLIAFLASVGLVGFLITVPIYVLAFMTIQGRKPLKQSIFAAVVVTLVIWVAFDVLLRYEVYPGILFEG